MAASVQEQMRLQRGHRFPARCIDDLLRLVSFNPGCSADSAVSLNGLRETPRGVVILREQPMFFLAVHGTISMGTPNTAQVGVTATVTSVTRRRVSRIAAPRAPTRAGPMNASTAGLKIRLRSQLAHD
jgi:hypothetical protein